MVNQLTSWPVGQLASFNQQTGKPANRQTDEELFSEAKKYISGGINSPVRSFKAVGGYPVFIKKAKGSKIYSEDNKEYIDYCLSFGALILGHGHPEVKEALKKAIEKGSCFGAPTKSETELAGIITQAVPSIGRLRLTNSGTEAVMGAVRLARAFTKKNKIIKFSGAYHGHADYLLSCPGVPQDFKRDTLVCPYNDNQIAEEIVKRYQKDIAAIIVEPVAGNAGVVLPREGFLAGLRRLCDKYSLVLIFDEVITGFRLCFGGAQDYFKVRPDLTCLGKIIGGGLPVGAFGGRKEIMDLLAPQGEVYQAGTFSGNPLTVNAGLATLKILSNERPYKKLAARALGLCEKLKEGQEKYGRKIKVNFIGSMFSISFKDADLFKNFYHGMLKRGVYFAPSPSEADFLSVAHTDADINRTIDAAARALQ